jgi:hypothetical protein
VDQDGKLVYNDYHLDADKSFQYLNEMLAGTAV